MSNITNLNRDYLIKINVKEATIDVPKMTFWNTDKKTSNMFVQLVINMSENKLIENYVTIENATDYKIVLNVIKPKTNQYRTFEAKLLNEEKALFEIDLTSEFIDQVGNYNFEFEVSSKVENNDESITTSSSTYEVKGSILTNLNQEISSSPDLPILKQLIEQVKSLQGGDLTGYQKKSDNSLETTSKEVVGAINEVNSQFKDIAKKIEDGSLGTSVEPQDDDIPKVFFYGDISTMSKSQSVDLDFEYKSKTATYKGVATTKWQGSSSLSYPKKNYTIKLFTDNTKSTKLKLNMKNWGKQNKFCLKANYVDSLHHRNITGARIAYDMIKSRNDFSSLPTELQEAPRCGVIDGFPIKVYMNGELIGLYTWNIPKDKWCSNMDEYNPNHAFLMAEKNNNGSATDSLVLACEFRANATIFADTSTAQFPAYDWVVEGPGDDVSAEIRTSFNNLINCIKDTDDTTFKATIGNYLDLTSAFDYYIFAYFVCHYDGLAKNLGMATYDGTKWFCTLYDMDSIFGATINGSGFLETNRKCPEQYQETNSLLWQRIENCFGVELYARYKQLRQGALSLGNIFTHAEEIYDIIPDRLYNEDRAKWTSLPSVNTNTIKRMRDYMIARASYVDSEMQIIGTPKVACTGITLNNSTLTFTSTNAQTLTATITPTNTTDEIVWSVSPTGICTVNNGIITPIANGNCTVTVTCGTKTATCHVTVSGISVQYSITNNLTNVTNSNNAITISENSPYNAILTPNSPYTLGDVTVTMGDVDVTSTVYNNGTITITSVTGNIIITATVSSPIITHSIILDGTENWRKIGWTEWSSVTDLLPFEINIESKMPKGMIIDENDVAPYCSVEGYPSILSSTMQKTPQKGVAIIEDQKLMLQIAIEASNLESSDAEGFKTYLSNNNLILKVSAVPDNLLNVITDFESGSYNNNGDPITSINEKRSGLIELPANSTELYVFMNTYNKNATIAWFFDENQNFIKRQYKGNKFVIPSNAKYFTTRIPNPVTECYWSAI